jgi:hypothetical protein
MAETMLQTLQTLQHDILHAAVASHDTADAKWHHVFQQLKTDLQHYKGNNAKVIALATGWALKDAGLINKCDIIRGIGVGDNEIKVYRTSRDSKPGSLVEVTSHGVAHPHLAAITDPAESADLGGVEEMNGAFFVWLNPYIPEATPPLTTYGHFRTAGILHCSQLRRSSAIGLICCMFERLGAKAS